MTRRRRPPLQLGPGAPLSPLVLGMRTLKGRPRELVGVLPGRPRLAVVGSRAAHRRTLAALGPILAVAGARGWSLVSGGALGVDGAAHRAALAHGVAQLAVLPLGRDQLYPPGHADLFAALLDSGRGGLVFAQPPGAAITRGMFASRNELVVGLADAVLVAEASLRSGSRGTGELALTRGKALAALAGSPGCGVLIGAGARAFPGPPSQAHVQAHPNAEGSAALAELAAGIGAWLDGIHGQGSALEATAGGPPTGASSWPAHLAWLAPLIHAAGPAGVCADALPDLSQAMVALMEAELLGLVCEATPGRWVVLSS